MAVLPKCPACGLESTEIRCPRCNTLKVLGCTGSCALCGSKASCSSDGEVLETDAPSSGAREDLEHLGTPLER